MELFSRARVSDLATKDAIEPDTLVDTQLVDGPWLPPLAFKSVIRGITLLDVVGKLYTKIIDSRLSAWLDTHDRLRVSQAGFGSQRSCVDHVFSLSLLFRSALGRDFRRGCFSGMRLRPLIGYGGTVCLTSSKT